jgi:hypothetical protein
MLDLEDPSAMLNGSERRERRMGRRLRGSVDTYELTVSELLL